MPYFCVFTLFINAKAERTKIKYQKLNIEIKIFIYILGAEKGKRKI